MSQSDKPVVSVVIGSYNRLGFLKSTIESVRVELSDIPHELIVIDGGSDDGSLEWLTNQKDVISIVQHNRGEWLGKPVERKSWGYFMNLGFRAASGKFICMLSDDCLVVSGAIKNGIELFEEKLSAKDKVGAIAFYWRNWPEQEKYWVGLTFGNHMFVNHGLYLRSALESVDFLDADTFFFYHADGDLCLRLAKAGYKCIESSNSYIEHFRHANEEVRDSNLKRQQHDWKAYEKRWQKLGKPTNDWIEKEFRDPSETANRYWKKKNFIRRIKR